MYVVKNDNPVYIDVDDTLISWNFNPNEDKILISCDGVEEWYNPIHTNIDYLKKHRSRGHRIVIWSRGGWEWAESVVKALKLEEYVDVVAAKPRWIIDDLESEEWMPRASFGDKKFSKEIED